MKELIGRQFVLKFANYILRYHADTNADEITQKNISLPSVGDISTISRKYKDLVTMISNHPKIKYSIKTPRHFIQHANRLTVKPVLSGH